MTSETRAPYMRRLKQVTTESVGPQPELGRRAHRHALHGEALVVLRGGVVRGDPGRRDGDEDQDARSRGPATRTCILEALPTPATCPVLDDHGVGRTSSRRRSGGEGLVLRRRLEARAGRCPCPARSSPSRPRGGCRVGLLVGATLLGALKMRRASSLTVTPLPRPSSAGLRAGLDALGTCGCRGSRRA